MGVGFSGFDRVRPLGWDAALALAVAVAGFTAASGYHGRLPVVLFVLAALGTLPLVVRCLFPVSVLAVVVAVAAIVGLTYTHGWWPFAAIVALYTVAAHCDRRTAIIAGGATLFVLAVPILYAVDWSPLGWNDVALIAGRFAPLVAAWLLGDNVRTRRDYLRAVEERAAQLEREQDANARRAAAEEQSRIAREVHDVVAHNLSVIVVQATAADAVFRSDPEDARRAVRTIGSTARRALDELRHVLGSEEQAASHRCPRSLGWTSYSGGCGLPDSKSSWLSSASSETYRRHLTSPPTGSCKKRLRTPFAIPAPHTQP